MQESIASTAQRSAHRTRLSICYLPLAQLKPDPRNARVHSKKQIRQIARSIESFGFYMPILIDGENNIVAGHARVLAAKLLGLAEVPAVRLEHLTEAQRRAFAIADNRLTEIASWDDRLLGETLKELAILDLDFALEATGFETGEIDLRIEALSQNERDPVEPPIPAVSGLAVTQTGDLWLLDRHRLLCGDALDAEAYHTLLGSKTASAAFTDPPYNVPIDGHVSGLGQTRHREFPMAAGEMDAAAFTKFLETSLRHMAAFILIEDKASGTQLIQDLLEAGFSMVTRFEPEGDKVMRLHAQTATIENGFVHLPREAHWLADYVHELTLFPNGRHDDQVDSTSQALAWTKQRPAGWALREIYRQKYEKARNPGVARLVRLAAPTGISHVQTKSGETYAVRDGFVSVPEDDAPFLYGAGFRRA